MLSHFLGRIIFLARLGRILFLARLRVSTVFVISITSLKKAVIITVAPTHFFLFGLNSTSFHCKLNGKWTAAFKMMQKDAKRIIVVLSIAKQSSVNFSSLVDILFSQYLSLLRSANREFGTPVSTQSVNILGTFMSISTEF